MSENNLGDPYIRKQLAARNSSAVYKTRLLSLRSRFPIGLIIAVEGDADKVVYSHWIKRVCSTIAYEFLVCDGKRGVRSLKNSLTSDLFDAEKDVVYFVDRDFDDLKGFSNDGSIFLLERYSIENFLVEAAVIDGCLKVAFPGSGSPAERIAICELFDADYTAFVEASREINRRVFQARQLSFDIDGILTDSITNIADVRIGSVSAIANNVAETLPFPRSLDEAEISRLDSAFASLDGRQRYRGKFAYKFLRVWLDALCAEYRSPKFSLFGTPASTGKIKPDEMSLGSLASNSPLPEGFGDFILKLVA